MPLNQETLAAKLAEIFRDVNTAKTPEQAAQELAEAIDEYVRQARVVGITSDGKTVEGHLE